MSGQQNPNKQIPTRAHVEKAFQTILDACEATAYLQPGSQDAYPNRYVQPGSQDAYPNRYVQPGSQSALPHRIGGPLTVSKYGSTGLSMSQQVAQGMFHTHFAQGMYPTPVAQHVPEAKIDKKSLRKGLEILDDKIARIEKHVGLPSDGISFRKAGDAYFLKPSGKNFIQDAESVYVIRTEEGQKAFDAAKEEFKGLEPQQSDAMAYMAAEEADEAAISAAGSSKKAKIGHTEGERKKTLKKLLKFEANIDINGDDLLAWAKTLKAAKDTDTKIPKEAATPFARNLLLKGYVYFTHETGRNPFKKPTKEDRDAFHMYKHMWGFNEADDWDGTI